MHIFCSFGNWYVGRTPDENSRTTEFAQRTLLTFDHPLHCECAIICIFPLSFLQSNCSELGAVCMALNQDLKLTRCVCSNGVILDHVHPKCSSCKFSEFSLYFLHICDCFLTSQKSCYKFWDFNLSF